MKSVTAQNRKEAKEAIGYQWNDIAGTRHYLGGEPEGLIEQEHPKCNECSEKMTFYAQIDSIGDQFDLADCMVIHNFVCFNCFTVKAILTKSNA